MIISDSEEFVFVHNPKCGGMSFRTVLLEYETREDFFFDWKPVGPKGKTLDMAHITPFQFRKFFPGQFASVDEYCKFVFVRNPYDRFLSAISQHLKLCTISARETILSDSALFLLFASRFAETRLEPTAVRNAHKLVHFRPQTDFTHLDGAPWVDSVFHLETPQEWQTGRVGKWLASAEERRNETDQPHYRMARPEQLSAQAIGNITRFYGVDFDNFGYDRM